MKLFSGILLFVALGSCFAETPLMRYDRVLETSKYKFALLPQDDVNQTPQLVQRKESAAPKNKGKAMFMSLLVPGWGQRYAGASTKSMVFFGFEVAAWMTYGGFTAYGNWRENDYETFAASHAGVNLDGKNHTYFIDVGNFDDIYEHNAYRLQQRNWNKYYQDVEFYYWKWDSKENMQKFDDLRISADTADSRAKFVLGAIVANHIVSAIDAVWSVHRYEQNQLSNFDWDVRFGDGLMQPAVNVNLTAHF
jgi:hypothetical protein